MDEDGEDAAEAFDVEKDMKTMWGHVWSLAGWNKLWRMQVWTIMLLVGICIFARASSASCQALDELCFISLIVAIAHRGRDLVDHVCTPRVIVLARTAF